jgi:hypothetical protein
MTRKAVLSGSGRSREKRPDDGTSLAAYFIVLPLLTIDGATTDGKE